MTEVVVVGSANLDLVVEVDTIPLVGETVLGGDLRRIPGGKGANQAVAAARLGRDVAMVGRIGDDEGGTILRTALERDGVDTTHVVVTADTPNGVALISVGADGDNAIVVSPGANGRVSPADIDTAGELLDAATVTLLQLEVPLDAVQAAAARAGGTVILNPAPAPAEPLPMSLLADVDVLVPNQTELATLAGHDGSVDLATAADLAGRLPSRSVIVTLGADGALVVLDGDATHVPAPVVTPVDTTAAGILRAVKNRFGPADEIGVFEMTGAGLAEVANPSALFLGERDTPAPGSVVFAGIEGTRPLLVEIQALVAPSQLSQPRRAVVGWDGSRLSMILAVLESRTGITFAGLDVYLNVAGGIRIQEPAADLAVACALLSAREDAAIPPETVVFGELSLSGALRPVAQAENRLKEAAKLGFTAAMAPKGCKTGDAGQIVPRLLPDLSTLVGDVFGAG
ncbi:MAG: PfkB family carbohydrate kinase [Pseudomonadota bacterium]